MIFCFGSINVDHIYRVTRHPAPGETLAALSYTRELGGKGANQSVAAARAGSQVLHIGSVGPDGAWTVEALQQFGVGTAGVTQGETATGHAIITVDEAGENSIVIYPGANAKQSLTRLKTALSKAEPGDILLLQNETNLQADAAQLAQAQGLTVIYSAAPFDVDAVRAVIDHVDMLVLNAVEAAQLTNALGQSPEALPPRAVIVTKGSDGADWIEDGQTHHAPARPVSPVDTTGAGDCFLGYLAAGLDQGLTPQKALTLASAAASLQIQRPGTAGAIPARAEVDALLS